MGDAGVAVVDGFERSIEQRMTALDRANEIRCWRAQMKRDLKAGRRRIVPLLREPPPELESMKLVDLLVAMPKVGRVKSMRMLSRLGVSPAKTVGGLTSRQRGDLIAFLS